MFNKVAMFDYNTAIDMGSQHLNLTPEQAEMVKQYANGDLNA